MRDRRLEVEVIDGELRISIGVETLKFATEKASDPPFTWLDEDTEEFMCFEIIDADQFAEDVKSALLAEREDGATPVHLLLDAASMSAIEEGSEAVAEEPIVAK